jgi:hypothetical protein
MSIDPYLEERLYQLARSWVKPGPPSEDPAVGRQRWQCAVELLELAIEEGAPGIRCLACGEPHDGPNATCVQCTPKGAVNGDREQQRR